MHRAHQLTVSVGSLELGILLSVSTGGTLVVWDSELQPTQKPVVVSNELNKPLILSAAATGTKVAAYHGDGGSSEFGMMGRVWLSARGRGWFNGSHGGC